jgi:hypothetical protein
MFPWSADYVTKANFSLNLLETPLTEMQHGLSRKAEYIRAMCRTSDVECYTMAGDGWSTQHSTQAMTPCMLVTAYQRV